MREKERPGAFKTYPGRIKINQSRRPGAFAPFFACFSAPGAFALMGAFIPFFTVQVPFGHFAA